MIDSFREYELRVDTLLWSPAWGDHGAAATDDQTLDLLERPPEFAKGAGFPMHSVPMIPR